MLENDLLDKFFSLLSSGLLSEYAYLLATLVGSIGLIALILAIILIKARGTKKEIHKILRGTEEFLHGNYEWRIDVANDGELGKISANINQIVSDFRERSSEIENSRDYFHNLVESAADCAILSVGTDWDIVSFNTGAASLLGWEKEQIIGKNASVIFGETTWLSLLSLLAKKEFKERSFLLKGEFKRKDGTLFQGKASIHPVRSKAVAIVGFLLIVGDISEEEKLEKELKASEERYRSLSEGLAEAVFIMQKGKIIFANSALATLLGSNKEQLVGSLFLDFVSTEDLILAMSSFNELESNPGKKIAINLRIMDRTGRGSAEMALVVSSISFQGEPAIIASMADITENARMERRMRVHEMRLQSTVDSVSDAILLVDELPSGATVVLVNKSWQKLFGIEPVSLLGLSLERVMDVLSAVMKNGEDFRRKMAWILGGAETREALLFELEKPEPRIIECVTSAIEEAERGIGARVFSFRDVTNQKEFEERLKENAEELKKSREALEKAYSELNIVNENLQRRAQELDRMNQELRTLDEMKTKLLANVSHELQTPLVSIKGYTEMILKRKLGAITEEQEKGLKVSLKNIDRLIRMIDNLLNFSRLGKEEEKLQREEFPLWQVIDEAIELVREKMEASDISIMTKYQTEDLQVNADRGRISQVFINLLSNAIKFNRHGGEVFILVSRGTPGYLIVDVNDTGIGIPPEHLDKIFERFYRVQSMQARALEGTGIGLSIVRDILKQHQCDISVRSKVGEGSTFTFTLPLAEARERSLTAPPAESSIYPQEEAETEKPIKEIKKVGTVKIKIIKSPIKGRIKNLNH
ncbi:MAG: PAS domain S-box protein [Acidobacteriota bacterium]